MASKRRCSAVAMRLASSKWCWYFKSRKAQRRAKSKRNRLPEPDVQLANSCICCASQCPKRYSSMFKFLIVMLIIQERVVQHVVISHAWPSLMWAQMRAFYYIALLSLQPRRQNNLKRNTGTASLQTSNPTGLTPTTDLTSTTGLTPNPSPRGEGSEMPCNYKVNE